jgi:hypothetical protein
MLTGPPPKFHGTWDILPMAAMSSLTLSKEPRRIAWRVMIEKNTSTRFSQDPEVGVKRSVTRGFLASHVLMSACLWVW